MDSSSQRDALFDAVRAHLSDSVRLLEVDAEINDPEFARTCAETLVKLMEEKSPSLPGI